VVFTVVPPLELLDVLDELEELELLDAVATTRTDIASNSSVPWESRISMVFVALAGRVIGNGPISPPPGRGLVVEFVVTTPIFVPLTQRPILREPDATETLTNRFANPPVPPLTVHA
jgi:hypothetical protein